ncbi:MAG: coproporphyrinogen dehydrogenase HemZ, partial [Firmicutes bacterium]|nr:coproporphyrinogen dehydrogenase HemZ [Bacillota bacterium]
KHGVDRISINPQSMKQRTLELIGRSHKPEDIVKAFQKAYWCDIPMVNADVIAGLQEETVEDFKDTMERLIKLDATNITVHTLAVKRASRLMEEDPDYAYRQGELVADMLAEGVKLLAEAGYRPYYLYRQKHMAGSFENVGYCKGDTPCIYNIRIMEEQQTIIALGAGGISKVYFPEENRLERVPNVSNYEIYIERLEEMLDRKENNLFKEVTKC